MTSQAEDCPSLPLSPGLSAMCSACGQGPRPFKTNNGVNETKTELEALKRCQRCRAAYYHDATCQRKDWPRHKKECRALSKSKTPSQKQSSQHSFSSSVIPLLGCPLGLVTSPPPRGKFCVARRPLPPGVVLSDPSLMPESSPSPSGHSRTAIGFPPIVHPVLNADCRGKYCSFCFAKLDPSSPGESLFPDNKREFEVARSKYPINACSVSCRKQAHKIFGDELEALGRLYDSSFGGPPVIFGTAILVYRFLRAVAKEQLSWKDDVEVLQSHPSISDNREHNREQLIQDLVKNKGNTEDLDERVHEEAVILLVSFMLKFTSGGTVQSESEIQKIKDLLSKVKTNAFSIVAPVGKSDNPSENEDVVDLGVGVFQTAHYVNHSCQPNLHQSFHVGEAGCPPSLILTTVAPIGMHEEVCVSYIDKDLSLQERSAQLRKGYRFTCTCPRCANLQ